MQVEIEQAPRGTVSLRGMRVAEAQNWQLGQDAWEITARPNFTLSQVKVWMQSRHLVGQGDIDAARKCAIPRSSVVDSPTTSSNRVVSLRYLTCSLLSLLNSSREVLVRFISHVTRQSQASFISMQSGPQTHCR